MKNLKVKYSIDDKKYFISTDQIKYGNIRGININVGCDNDVTILYEMRVGNYSLISPIEEAKLFDSEEELIKYLSEEEVFGENIQD